MKTDIFLRSIFTTIFLIENIYLAFVNLRKNNKKIFCFCCKFFDRTPKSNLAIDAFSNLYNISAALTKHEKKVSNYFMSYDTWIKIDKK